MGDQVEVILDEWRRERPELDPSPMGIFGRITRVYGLAHRRLASLLQGFDLTPASFDVLANLRRAGYPYRRTPSELATFSMLTSGGMTIRLDKLEDKGLIKRVPAPNDRRVMYAELTDAGRALIDRVIGAHLEQEESMLAQLSAAQRRTLASCLATLEQTIDALDGDQARNRRSIRS